MLLLVWMPFHISKWTWELQTLGISHQAGFCALLCILNHQQRQGCTQPLAALRAPAFAAPATLASCRSNQFVARMATQLRVSVSHSEHDVFHNRAI